MCRRSGEVLSLWNDKIAVVFNSGVTSSLAFTQRRDVDTAAWVTVDFSTPRSADAAGPGVTAETRRPKCHTALFSAEMSQRAHSGVWHQVLLAKGEDSEITGITAFGWREWKMTFSVKAFDFNIIVSSLEFRILPVSVWVCSNTSSQLETLDCLWGCVYSMSVCVCVCVSCDGLVTSPGWILASHPVTAKTGSNTTHRLRSWRWMDGFQLSLCFSRLCQ